MEQIDKIIRDFKASPEKYDNNVWVCYSRCKDAILRMQDQGLVDLYCESYNGCIDYITEKLKI